MKFKVGDKVKVVKIINGASEKTLNEIGEIKKYNQNDNDYEVIFYKSPYLFGTWYYTEEELELIQTKYFIKTDLKDGDKCTLKDGQVVYYNEDSRYSSKYCFENLDKKLKFDLNDDVSIIKVERPVQYETVFKRKEEILDKAEKRWLSNFIKSTEIEVKYIKKWVGASGKNEYLEISYMNYYDKNNTLFLPIFKRNTKYKDMEAGKEYTLEELRTIGE